MAALLINDAGEMLSSSTIFRPVLADHHLYARAGSCETQAVIDGAPIDMDMREWWERAGGNKSFLAGRVRRATDLSAGQIY